MELDEAAIRTQLELAVRARDGDSATVLRGVLAALKNVSIEKRGQELGPSDVLAVVRREAKQCRESLDYARQAGRDDTVATKQAELALLEGLLPSQLSQDELKRAIAGIIKDSGATSLGPVMKGLSQHYAGRYDGKQASTIARDLLFDH
jgi:uncharacterized protein YqeY